MLNMNTRKAVIFGLLGASALGAYPFYKGMETFWGNRDWNRRTEKFMDALQKPFREDAYGGKTPEETWTLYVDAVKRRDIDLASKYGDVDHQYKHKEFLQSELQIDNLDLYLYQISGPLQKNDKVPDFLSTNKERAYYFYEFKSTRTTGVIRHDVNFYLNPLAKVWKILY